ncbi:hypothetical protein [Kangiella sp. TOML190]|uniref:hypothetical protein n=1 Tax=Kangiella sp. TOML190 TaxID=2931351 RepID=UPI00203C23A4|nr:hypothetical protein [Kangiella sp. TOML190]
MKLSKLATYIALTPAIFGLSLAALNLNAEEKTETVEIHIEQENDKDALVELVVNGQAEKFILADLAKGESRTIITESGNSVVANKDQDGNTIITLDGKDIQLFNPHDAHGSNFSFISADHDSTDFNMDDKIMIIGGNLSDDVKAALKATLQSYNLEKEIIFAGDGSDANVFMFKTDIEEVSESQGQNGQKEAKIIKRKRSN